MDFSDLDEARTLYSALMELFVEHIGGTDNPEALARVERLCDAAVRTIDDLDCRVAIRGARSYARLLFSSDATAEVHGQGLSGVDFLRLRIRNCLSAFRGRLTQIEAQRLREQQFALARRQRAEPRALSALPEGSQSAARPGVRVLVVEDNQDSAESLRRLLYHSGYEVAVAYTGQDGLRVARRIQPDVVLCDIGLPDTNGFAVAAELRGDPRTRDVRLIAVTAYGKDEDRRRAREAGFDLHLVKPVDPEVLLRKVADPASC